MSEERWLPDTGLLSLSIQHEQPISMGAFPLIDAENLRPDRAGEAVDVTAKMQATTQDRPRAESHTPMDFTVYRFSAGIAKYAAEPPIQMRFVSFALLNCFLPTEATRRSSVYFEKPYRSHTASSPDVR